jgi:hypothetical protein
MKIINIFLLLIFLVSLFSMVNAQDIYDMKLFYPTDENIKLIFEHYIRDGEFEILSIDPWEDNKSFTSRHQYFNSTITAPFCPRIDDVFTWDENKLYYTHTYNFYDNTLLEITPGHLWAYNNMKIGEVKHSTYQATFYNIDHSNCTAINKNIIQKNTHEVWFGIFNSQTWSEYTGGPNNPVNVILLAETTWVNRESKTEWKEK